MAQASQAEEPSMEEILASIRRIISDEEDAGNSTDDAESASDLEDNPVEIEAADEMGDASEMSQDDLDKLFDMDDGGDDVAEISADDDDIDMAAAMAAEEAVEETEAEVEEEDVLELTEELAVAEEVPAPEPVEPDDIAFVEDDAAQVDVDDAMEIPAPAPPSDISTAPVPMNDLPEVSGDSPLTSSETGEVVNAAFDNLSNMFIGSNAQTVEELVRDMLRPMLKAWLDQNLPGMVEQMVQKEIQRVTRRR